jgi:hypothetical protein
MAQYLFQPDLSPNHDAIILRIKQALANSLSLDANLRDEAMHFLIEECEPDPNFQLVLLQIIKSYSIVSNNSL